MRLLHCVVLASAFTLSLVQPSLAEDAWGSWSSIGPVNGELAGVRWRAKWSHHNKFKARAGAPPEAWDIEFENASGRDVKFDWKLTEQGVSGEAINKLSKGTRLAATRKGSKRRGYHHTRATKGQSVTLWYAARWKARDKEYKGRGAYRGTDDGRELLHHLELMRAQRDASLKDRIEWLRQELSRTRDGGPRGLTPDQLDRRARFLMEALMELSELEDRKRRPPGASNLPKSNDDEHLPFSPVDPGETLEQGSNELKIMSWLSTASGLTCFVGSFPWSAACGYEIGSIVAAGDNMKPLEGVRALRKRDCQLTAYKRFMEHPYGRRGRFWTSVYEGVCSRM